jgi:predicted aspartyl protease
MSNLKKCNLIQVLLAVLVLLSGSCRPVSQIRTVTSVRFFKIGQIPVVEGTINGKSAYFVIDTGASCTILDESKAEHYGFTFNSNHTNDHVTALGGEVKINRALDCIIEIGPLKIKNVAFRTKSIDFLIRVIQENEHINLAGIIGSDILNRYSIIIDFKKNFISF